MAYSINPNLPKARAFALKLLIEQALPVQVVANRCGVHRTTIYRWKTKWLAINRNVQLENFNRPNRELGGKFRSAALRWLIPTISSRPKFSPRAIPENIVRLVIQVRRLLNRCSEVVWFHLVHNNGVSISLSSVRRILKRRNQRKGENMKEYKIVMTTIYTENQKTIKMKNYPLMKKKSLSSLFKDCHGDRKSTRLNSSHRSLSRMPSSA